MDILKRYWKALVISAILIAIYYPTIEWMVDRWNARDSYYSHGFLIPFVSLYVLWVRREKIRALTWAPSVWGLWLMLAGLLVHVLSAVFRVYFTSAFSILPVVAGCVLYLGGWALLKECLFAILFLAFMIPLPLVAIVGLTFRMKLFAAYWANKILNGMGIQAVLDGSVIRMRHTHVIVEDVCSGLRSLISLVALGTIIAYLSKLSRFKKVIVFLASGIMAIVANIVRIVFMAWTSEVYGAKFTEGFLHTLSGLMVFVVAFVGLMIVVKELE